MTLAVYPCTSQSVRGLRGRTAIVDELAHFTTSDGRRMDVEMLRAVRPTLATTGGKLIILSSPYAQTGALYDLHKNHYGRRDSKTLVWQASAVDMHPGIDADRIARQDEDPIAFASEVMGLFRPSGASTFLEPEAIQECIVAGRRELMPRDGVRYRAFSDPSGGGKDVFALCIGHRDHDRVVLDAIRAWHSKNPSGTVAEAAHLLRSYGISKVIGDKYSAEWVKEAFRSHVITYEWCDLDRSALYLELLPAINSAAVELLDNDDLLHELQGLERRRGSSGRDRIDHRPGSHDDRANVVAGVVGGLGTRKKVGRAGFGWHRPDSRAEELKDPRRGIY